MEEFPPNTHKSREHPAKTPSEPEPKKVEKVVAGKVVRRKKPLGSRIKELFIGGDSSTVWEYVAMDVLIPAAKDMVADAASQGIERLLFGESHHYGRRGGRPRGRGPGRVYTDYGSRYTTSRDERDRPPFPGESRGMSRKARANHDFNEVILATRAEAEEVIDRLFDLVSRYESATVADLYDLLGLTSQYTDDKWGWYDIRGADIRRVRDGYLLDLPRPRPLD